MSLSRKRASPFEYTIGVAPRLKKARAYRGGPYSNLLRAQMLRGMRPRLGYSSVPRARGAAVAGEMKYFDTRVARSNIPAVAAWTGTEFDPTTFNTLCVPVVGAALNQRIGRHIRIMKIKINGHIEVAPLDSAAPRPAMHVMIALVQDMQTNSTQAQGEQIFTATTTADEAPLTFQNVDNFGRFRVLKRKSIVMQDPNIYINGAGVDNNGLNRPFKISIKFRIPVDVRFNATNGGTIADIVDNSFHMYANSSNADWVPTISYLCRVCFKE